MSCVITEVVVVSVVLKLYLNSSKLIFDIDFRCLHNSELFVQSLLFLCQKRHIFSKIDGLPVGLVCCSMSSILVLSCAVKLNFSIRQPCSQVVYLTHCLTIPLVKSLQGALISLLDPDQLLVLLLDFVDPNSDRGDLGSHGIARFSLALQSHDKVVFLFPEGLDNRLVDGAWSFVHELLVLVDDDWSLLLARATFTSFEGAKVGSSVFTVRGLSGFIVASSTALATG